MPNEEYMQMQATLIGLREDILNAGGFHFKNNLSPQDVIREYRARHPCFNQDLPNEQAWDTHICGQKDDIVIVLQYLKRQPHGTQKIRIEGHEFFLRLALYDNNPLSDFRNHIGNRSELRRPEKLGDQLDRGNSSIRQNNWPYELLIPARNYNDNPHTRQYIGHIVDLRIKSQQPEVWDIGNDTDKNAFVTSAANALGILLPIADYYVTHRENLFKAEK